MNREGFKTCYEWAIEKGIKIIGLEKHPEDEKVFYTKPCSEETAHKIFYETPLEGVEVTDGLHLKSEIYLELRMFTLVPYNIMGIQKGIQHEHSVTQYLVDHVIDAVVPDERAKRWARSHKTVIVKNGGTSNEGHEVDHIEGSIWYVGTMQQARETLKELDVRFSEFYEPDLNSMLTGLSLIADERVFDRRKYPDYNFPAFPRWVKEYEGEWITAEEMEELYDKQKEETWVSYLEMIGGELNHKLREFLFSYKLA